MEKKFIIPLGRQLGSGGLEVARILSQRLDAKLLDKELLKMAAVKSGYSEELFKVKDEKPRGFSFGNFFGLRSNVNSNSFEYAGDGEMSSEELFALQASVMKSAVKEGSAIVVGRCADYILRDEQNLLTVFITADLPDRIARIASRKGVSEGEAEKIINQGDKSRSAYYDYFTFKKWGDGASYDVCLNSSRLGIDGCVDTIIELLEKHILKG